MAHQHCIAACARWESEYIIEWVLYHLMIGFDHIYLYCNDDDPEELYGQVLPFCVGPNPRVTFLHFPYQGQQRHMYVHWLQHFKNESAWIIFLDIDEFLALRGSDNIRALMSAFPANCDAVHFNWVFFGNSGFVQRPKGSVLLQYVRRDASLHALTKAMARTASIDTDEVRYDLGSTFWHDWGRGLRDPARRYNVLGDPMTPYFQDFPASAIAYLSAGSNSEQIFARALIHHYAFKSEQDFVRRVERGTMGSFVNQTIWKDLHESGGMAEFLGHLNAVADPYLRGFWLRSVGQGSDKDVNPKPPYRNVALGKRAEQSSICEWSGGRTTDEDASRATSGTITGRYSFHTAPENQPWWMVDLQDLFLLREIRLFNRYDDLGIAARANRLAIEVSPSGEHWTEVFRKEDDALFGGADGNPLILELARPPVARYVRITLLASTCLHLDQVEIYGEAAPAAQNAGQGSALLGPEVQTDTP